MLKSTFGAGGGHSEGKVLLRQALGVRLETARRQTDGLGDLTRPAHESTYRIQAPFARTKHWCFGGSMPGRA